MKLEVSAARFGSAVITAEPDGGTTAVERSMALSASGPGPREAVLYVRRC